MRTLLAVLAHPDDESFGFGGTLALYASGGTEVHLACATRGEAGTVDPVHLGNHRSIGELRESELRCASERLGLRSVVFLGYRDSGMAGSAGNAHPEAFIRQPLNEVAGRIVRCIRELKPDVVVTFDPMGVYGHPDHIHVHQATVMAFERAGDATFFPDVATPFAPRALYFHVVSHQLLRIAVRIMPLIGMNPRKSGRNHNIDLKRMAEAAYPVHVRVSIQPARHMRDAARACHASQGGSRFGRDLLSRLRGFLGERDQFMRAYPMVSTNAKVSDDLFDV